MITTTSEDFSFLSFFQIDLISNFLNLQQYFKNVSIFAIKL